MTDRMNISTSSRSMDASQNVQVNDDFMSFLKSTWRAKWSVFFIALIPVILTGFYAYKLATPQYMSRLQLAINIQDNEIANVASLVSGASTESSAINTELQIMRSRKLIGEVVDRLDLVNTPEFNPSLRPPTQIDQIRTLLGLGSNLTTDLPPAVQRERTINELRRAVTALSRRGTYILEIQVVSSNRSLSADVANTLGDVYINEQLNTKFQSTEFAVNWLSDRVSELEDDLFEREEALKELQASVQLVDESTLNALIFRAQDIRSRLERLPPPSEDEDDIGNYTSQRNALANSLKELEARIQEQSRDLTVLTQTEREVEATRVLYQTFLARLKEASLQIGFQRADSYVMEPARSATKVAPNPPLLLMSALILGLVMGSLIVFFREKLQTGLKTVAELESATGHTVIGQVPIIPINHRADLINYLHNNPTSGQVESIRNLRTSLLLSNIEKPPQVIISTSSIPGEGKTTQAIALAAMFGGVGKKILLIGADVRRLSIAEYFPAIRQSKLSSVISGESSLDDSLVHDDRLNIDIISEGSVKDNPANIFSSKQFQEFLDNMREIYDFIIIDSPPFLWSQMRGSYPSTLTLFS